jgi:predicted ATPase
LLVLDNLEHLLDAAPVVGELLAAGPHLKILVTSRTFLNLYGEHEFLVPPLAVANLHRLPPLEDLMKAPAIALFLQRAQAVQPDFRLAGENARAVAELCVHLDGLPLALELAAARVKFLPPAAMLARLGDRLGDRLSFLGGGPRNLPARHQTIARTIEWSYQLLDKGEQALLRRLAVFAGGGTWEAIAAVTAQSSPGIDESPIPLPEWTRVGRLPTAAPAHPISFLARPTPFLLAQTESLLNKSLLRNVEGFRDEPRIGMLEIIRAYALQRLQEEGEDERFHRQHLHYYLRFAEAARYHLTGAEAAEWFDRLAIEYNNLRAALDWAIAHRPVLGLRLAVALAEFWDTRGLLAEGRHWLGQALARVKESTPLPTLPPALPVVGQLELARLALRASDFGQEETLVEAARWAREQGHQELLADALVLNGRVQIYQERYEEGVRALEEAVTLGRAISYPIAVLTASQTLGVTLVFQNQPERAIPYLEESLRLAQALDAVRAKGITLAFLGFAELASGQVAAAHQRFGEGMTICAQIRDMVFMVYPLIGLIQLASRRDQPQRAAQLIGAVDSLLRETAATLISTTRAWLETVTAQVEARLGEEQFEVLRREGQTMMLDQVIQCALAGN